jgi:hypothetical protein
MRPIFTNFLAAALAFVLLVDFGLAADSPAPLQATLLQCNRIWSEAPHNAFTSLIRWRDRWYCAFREGEGHVSQRGQLRIITSTDGRDWQSAAVLTDPVYDLRDANLSVTPDNKLMMVGGAQISQDSKHPTGTFAAFSDDGTTWTKPELILPVGRWMWGVTWHQGTAWGVSYAAPDDRGVNSLLKSTDGRRFDVLVKDFFVKDNNPTEARLCFGSDDKCYCLQRCEGKPNHAYLGTANPPYNAWQWRELDRFIGGPNLLQLPNKRWVAAGRIFDANKPKTALMELDVESARVVPILDLPSGGDCSYPGLVWHEGKLWMSYYSSHEGKASIYLATIELE